VPKRDNAASPRKATRTPDHTAAARNKTVRPKSGASRADGQRLESIGRLTAGVAHDFNNILTVVIGNSELLIEQLPGDDPRRRLAEVTLTAARSGADLIRMLLAYSRQQQIAPVEFDANALVVEMLDLLLRSLGGHIKIKTTLDAALWGIRADRAQLGSVLLNLAVNARDAMNEDGVLRIETANVRIAGKTAKTDKMAAGDYVAITVSDTGAGMSAKVLARAFEPFFTTKGRGTGLGLAMVDGFARRCRGYVRIASAPGAGTAVRLYLPRSDIQLDLPHIANEAVRPARPGETILLIEDNAGVRDTLIRQLKHLDYRVIAAADAKQALKELRHTARVDLLLSDVGIKGGGARLAQSARQIKPGLRILFTSALSDQGVAGATPNSESDFVLAKPYRSQELAYRLRATLDEIL
jgi:nitrogen-specific signal transduction histidine kinase/CheY-like chemotaxis protein